MRNEVGFNYDNQGRIWGVENGIDNLDRPDLGPNLVFNNPGEEVNLFIDDPSQYNRFYGYPYCWSELFLPPATAKGPGTQWVHPHFMNTGRPEGIPFVVPLKLLFIFSVVLVLLIFAFLFFMILFSFLVKTSFLFLPC